MIVIPILGFMLVVISYKKKSMKFNLSRIDERFKEKGSFIYDRFEKYIKQVGLPELFDRNVSPSHLVFIKISMALIGFIMFANKNLLLSLFISIVGWFIPNLILYISNTSDNEDIIVDLKKIYDILRIQTKAGVFFTTSLSECYLAVENTRLKKALLKLTNDILTSNQGIEDSIDEFNSKFKNQHIDTFCVVIKQSIESGQSVQILADLSTQIKDLQDAINLKEAERVKTKLEILEFFIYIGVIAIVIYGMIYELRNGFSTF